MTTKKATPTGGQPAGGKCECSTSCVICKFSKIPGDHQADDLRRRVRAAMERYNHRPRHKGVRREH